MNALAPLNETDYQPLWFAYANVERQELAPYAHDKKVTPLSVYGDDEWLFPLTWLSPGQHTRNRLCFANWSESGTVDQLIRGIDDQLIEQLKEAAYCLIFHRHKLPGKRKTFNARPKTLDNEIYLLRPFFVVLKKAGIKSLNEFTQKVSEKVIRLIEMSPKQFNMMIDYIDCVLVLCKLGLIQDGPKTHTFTFKKKKIAEDTSKRRGVQPLTTDQVAEVISTALFYLQNGHELCDMVVMFREMPDRYKLSLIERFAIKYPVFHSVRPCYFEEKVSKLLQISAFHVTGFHLGMRISEFLSQKVGSLGIHSGTNVMFADRLTLHMTTIKSAETLYGHSRYFPVHPYLQHVHSVLLKLRSLFEIPLDLLFTTIRTRKMWSISNFNRQLAVFNKEHGIEASVSTHVWRKTIVATTTLSVSNSLEALRELLGHAGVAESAAYALSSPFVKAEMDRENRKLVYAFLEDMVGDSLALGGNGLGGPQGVQLEQTLQARGVHKLSKRKKRRERDRLVEQSVTLNIAKVTVDEGIECFKQSHRLGACAKSSGDSLPDIAGCKPDCRYRVERSQRRTFLKEKIDTARRWLLDASIPMMERVTQARDLLESISGWPDLRPEFDLMLENNLDLKRFFGR
ncbi:hypothetical protein [Rhizobium laguerreae]|uniref:hypothetical protein n=1 Tax=Rhizobium laguerreae TaxID=1076926 RepID=UPI001C914088|nr:hypothetical protein [Rhizobium laguerreae]MBY3342867.1 hypothetical protein [Rhizobium laguerreae]MBY3349902.1 hypothetical protein [Rhizobium laguerreae]MBY3371005.1 hypothetical protein [Rhizobium laguerreae]MBY3426245.1 hypothetical protein [Rhizobium laguerreae]MBY3434203.1 hypothetical protein [Rhizobium laguerreae]